MTTYPFPKSQFFPKWKVRVNVDLREGLVVRGRWSGSHLAPPEHSPTLTHSKTCHNNLQIKNLPSSTSNTGMPSFFLDSGDSRKKPYSKAYSTAYSSFVSPTQSNIRSNFILHVLLIPPLQTIICQRRIANKLSFLHTSTAVYPRWSPLHVFWIRQPENVLDIHAHYIILCWLLISSVTTCMCYRSIFKPTVGWFSFSFVS